MILRVGVLKKTNIKWDAVLFSNLLKSQRV